MPAFAFLAALIGAGFASGREIQQFFARFGYHGLLFVLASAAELFLLSFALMTACRRFHAHSLPQLYKTVLPPTAARLSNVLFLLLLCITFGAMLCAGGELFALVFPIRIAYAVGLALTLFWSALGAVHSLRTLSMLGGLLAPLLTALLLVLLFLKPQHLLSVHAQPVLGIGAVLSLTYAPFNLVLCAGVLCETALTLSPRRIRTAAAIFAIADGLLLLLGTAVLLRHQAQIHAHALPFIVLSARLGRMAFLICVAVLYLAILSTLTALLRTLYTSFELNQTKQRAGCVFFTLACALCALLGFDRLISAAYPALGALCAVLLVFMLICARIKSPDDSASKRYD